MPSGPTNFLIQYRMQGQLLTINGPKAYQRGYCEVHHSPDLPRQYSGYVGQLQNISVATTATISSPASGAVIPTGPAGGDLFGNYPNPTVVGFQGAPLVGTPTAGEIWL